MKLRYKLLFVLLLLCVPHRAKADTNCASTAIGASYTCKQSAQGIGSPCSSSTGCTTTSLTITAGDFLLVVYAVPNTGLVSDTMTTSQGDTLTDTGQGVVCNGTANSGCVQMRYVVSAIGGATTATCKPNASGTSGCFLLDFAPNISTSTPVRPSAASSNTGTAAPSTSGTVGSLNGDLVIGVQVAGLNNQTGGSGGSISLVYCSGCGWPNIVAQQATGNLNIAATLENGEPYVMIGVAFEPLGAPPPPTNPFILMVR